MRPFSELVKIAMNSGLDVHRLRAVEIYKVPYEKVTPLQRNSAKRYNMGGAYSIQEPITAPKITGDTIAKFKATFPGVDALHRRFRHAGRHV